MPAQATAQSRLASVPPHVEQGLFALACNKPSNYSVSTKDLEAFDRTQHPRVSTTAAFKAMSSAFKDHAPPAAKPSSVSKHEPL
ncbi:hypothetical protein ACFQ1S_07790 [Kibdelosporangium lantanae]|uniref:Uncharacterized protein n=1 Tax=Kibdelosporangium lantanae TaxID=1497396 RepID=A0ABW3M613_9PSEU